MKHQDLTFDFSAAIIAACLPSIRLFFIPRSGTTSSNQRSSGRRNEAPFESLPDKDSLPLQNIVHTRPSQGRTESAESILRPEDKIHVRSEFLVSDRQIPR